jgi:dehydrogenase/reductase SDR family protein 12
MVKVEQSIMIDKPVEQVWNFLTDFQNTPKWDVGVLETRQTSTGPAGLGTTFQNIGAFLGQQSVREYRVTEYEPDKKVTVELVNPTKSIQKAEVRYTFEPAQTGTRLNFMGSIEFGGFFRLLQPILLQRAKRSGQGDLNNLKRLLEAQTDQA